MVEALDYLTEGNRDATSKIELAIREMGDGGDQSAVMSDVMVMNDLEQRVQNMQERFCKVENDTEEIEVLIERIFLPLQGLNGPEGNS